MNPNNWILLSLLTLTTACSKMVKEEPYLTAKEEKALSQIEGQDMPNTNHALSVPEVNKAHDGVPNDKPPAMAFARKRSKDENIVISDRQGQPTLEIYNDISPWELMIADHGSNWLLQSEDPESCEVTLLFSDPIAAERDQEGFFKRLFGSRIKYQDKSGQYRLNCIVEANKNLITVSKADGSPASPHVIDDIFSHIFIIATE